VLDLHTVVATTLHQVPTVNSQLIVRSELLQLPYLDLCARITEEAEENPALEVELDPLPLEHAGLAGEWQEEPAHAGAGAEERSSWGDPASRAPAEHTLRDDLRWRVGCLTDAQERRIAEYLIESIDERGYVTTTVFDAALELDVSEREVEAALERLQSLGPPGVGARDLRECLLLQLATFAREPAHVREVIAHCAQAVERGGWARLSRTLGLDEQELAQALEFIRESLHPYPGEQFRPPWQHLLPRDAKAPRALPEAAVFSHNGQFTIELAASRHIRVRLSEAYRRLDESMRSLNTRASDEATTRARAQVRAARQLMWSLDQRNRSVYRITQAIVEVQAHYLREGPLALKPLTHKQIAATVGLHESTVSRAVAGKLLMLPSGSLVPYSRFFESALPAKTVIKNLIRAELPGAPLTDERLQNLLTEQGFELARRTVTKYRLALGIPSSQRRRLEAGRSKLVNRAPTL